jgi:predicted Fe-S protein YdhL (DUF1289 family)
MTAPLAGGQPASWNTVAGLAPACEVPALPCVRDCCLDEAEVCTGCGLHVLEILAWSDLDSAGRQATLERAAARREARLPSRPGPHAPA